MNSVIIGGTSGIGLEAARYLKNIGYDIVVGGRTMFEEDGLIYQSIDVTKESSVEKFFSSIPFKKIESLIYTAGITTNKKNIQNFNVDEYLKVHNVNLLGAILTLKYAFPFLKIAKGRVVIVSSFAARTYSKLSGFEYTVTKTGLNGLVKQLAIEWSKEEILINSIFPSMVDTPMLRNNIESSVLRDIEASILLGRIANSSELVSAIEFLINERNTYITGAGIDINGGQYLSG